ncbi:MAG: hypothetical protein QMD82_00715 [bacterium]|nr:hypothetical protein [bacterium]
MLFLLISLVVGDTLRFTNPRVIDDSSANLVNGELFIDTVASSFDFEGSKGVFVIFQGFTFDLSQSLDLKLKGKLSNTVSLSARLKDDYTHYGNDYYSKSLEDVDEVYLSFEDVRGFGLNLGKFYHEGRKLLGFEGIYKNFKMVYGSTEQMRKKKIIEYRDFYPGPYFVDYGYLIVPGSVRVLLNGLLLDKTSYSFDYSSGALYLKDLKVLPDDVIYVEYSTYSTLPSVFTGVKGEFGNITFEFKRLNSTKEYYSGFPSEILEYFKETGDSCAFLSYRGGIKTSKGDYILQDSIFVFVGQGRGDYQVYFTFVGEGRGSYVFDNLIGGYKFVGKGNGLYEPEVDLFPPSLLTVGEIIYDGALKFSGRLSYKDLNTLSSKNDDDNIGYDLEFSRDFYTEFVNFHVKWRNRSPNFSTVDDEIDLLWGDKGNNFRNQFDLSFDLKKVGTSISASFRSAGIRKIYLSSLESRLGPFYLRGILSFGDTMGFKALASLQFKKLPSFNLLISKGDNVKLFLSDTVFGFSYLLGTSIVSKNKKLLWFSKAGFNHTDGENELFTDFFYFPEYQSSILYRLAGTTKLTDWLSINGSLSLTPALLPLQEERYYRTPLGMYNYDEGTGLFVPDVTGGYDRELISLGVLDTTLLKSYSFGASFDYNFSGSLQFEKVLSNFSDNTAIACKIRKNQFEFVWEKLNKNLSNVMNGLTTESNEFGLKFPFFTPIFLNLKYRDYREGPVNYLVWSGCFAFSSNFVTLSIGGDYTHFETLNFPGFHLDGNIFKSSDKIKVSASFYLVYPINLKISLPMAVPTSKRYGLNFLVKRPYKSGEFFVEGYYSKSLIVSSKIRAGYNFLF